MKHIGACLDGIQIALARMPREGINSEEKRARALKVLDEVEAYDLTLERLVRDPKFEECLHNLERNEVEGVRLKAHEVDDLLEGIELLLRLLDSNVQQLRDIIRDYSNHPDRAEDSWERKVSVISETIVQKFYDEMYELRKEFKLVFYKEEELRRLVPNEAHLAEFLA